MSKDTHKKKVLITGTSGLVGGAVWNWMAGFPDRYDLYALDRSEHQSDRTIDASRPEIPEGRFFRTDISDIEAVKRVMRGMDAVAHLAADPRPHAPWEVLLKSNIIGVYNILEAGRECGVKRVVFASSIMVSSGYRKSEPYCSYKEGVYGDASGPFPYLRADAPSRPDTIYASTKLWGEALARTYSEAYGMSAMCIRIGSVTAANTPIGRNKDVWCSFRDIGQLFQCCIEAPDTVKFDVFYSISNSRYGWVDIEHARKTVGYQPQDTVEI